ncbi:MAG: hypothetical protein WCL18_00085 [bacterium]
MIENTKPELDLNLDLNLPDAPKNDDRLKTEDQKNEKMVEPSIEPVIEQKIIEQKIEEPIKEQQTTPIVTESVESLFASPIDDTPTEPNTIVQNEEVVTKKITQEVTPKEKTPEIATIIEPVVQISEPIQTEAISPVPEQIPASIIEKNVQTVTASQAPEANIKTPEVIIPETIHPNTAGIAETQRATGSEAVQEQNIETQREEPATKIEDIPISSQSVD